MSHHRVSPQDFEKALANCRPPNVVKLFPNSRALIVSSKALDRAAREKGKSVVLAANGRNIFVIRGVLAAAQRANSGVIIEIARSEGGADAYCAVNYWNMARQVDALANEMGLTVPVAVHADHYGIKKTSDLEYARQEIPTLFEAGITSIAIDASHLKEDDNLLANIDLARFVPSWAGLETEVGEIKGASGLSTKEDALYHIQGLNANGVFPDWIALNNGTTHGIEASDSGIQVDLTARIHEAISPYKVSGAQHGTSGNSTEKLREITRKTRTTKANVATAFQMISWGVKVNDYGNAELDDQKQFVKEPDKGMSPAIWEKMKAFAQQKGYKAGDWKKLNLPFETWLMAQETKFRERMAKDVEDFAYHLMTQVFNSTDTAPLAISALLSAGTHDLGAKAERVENPAEWTEAKIREKAKQFVHDDGPKGNYDD
ncbi:MAG: class II fructose-bisphosphate aldolase [Thermodesulfobacteriota bacterium]